MSNKSASAGDRQFEQLPTALTGHLGYLLVVLGKRAQRAFSEALEPEGLRPAHFDIMAAVEAGRCSQATLSRNLALEPAHLVALLDELEAKQLVRRAADPDDRRRYVIELTTRGVTTFKRLARLSADVENDLMVSLSARDRSELGRLLTALARAGEHPSHEQPKKR